MPQSSGTATGLVTIALFSLFSAACARTGIERGRPDLDLDVTALDAAVVDVIDVGDGVTEVADGIDAPEIGRASCRERV